METEIKQRGSYLINYNNFINYNKEALVTLKIF